MDSPDPDFITICQPLTVLEVSLIHMALGESGIAYYITNEQATTAAGLGWGIGVGAAAMELRVEASRAEEAKELLGPLLKRHPGSRSAEE